MTELGNDTLKINNINSTSFKIKGNGGGSILLNGTTISIKDWGRALNGEKVMLKSPEGKNILFEGKPVTRRVPNLLFDGELLFQHQTKIFRKVKHIVVFINGHHSGNLIPWKKYSIDSQDMKKSKNNLMYTLCKGLKISKN